MRSASLKGALRLKLLFSVELLSPKGRRAAPQGRRPLIEAAGRSSRPQAAQFLSFVSSYNRYTADIHGRKTAQVVGQSELGILDLTLAGLPVKLKVHFIEHSQA